MKTKFTPGPWKIGPYERIVDANGEMVRVSGVSLPTGHVPESDTSHANAKLISKCPEMLTFLIDLREGTGLSFEQGEELDRILREAGVEESE